MSDNNLTIKINTRFNKILKRVKNPYALNRFEY